MTDDQGPTTHDAEPPDPEALELLARFQDAMRRGDVDTARSLAPGVEIRTDGWPYEDETGPLNPDAFRAGDPRDHEVIAWERPGPDRLVLRTGMTLLEMERRDGPLVITAGHHKPIE
jgi:hypothetical protein